jgi:hypothetical protein
MSSQAIWVQATGGLGALLVSPFNMKWRFSAQAQYHIFLIYSSVVGHPGYLHRLAIMNNATINIGVQMPLW